jgi:hypothetical protein
MIAERAGQGLEHGGQRDIGNAAGVFVGVEPDNVAGQSRAIDGGALGVSHLGQHAAGGGDSNLGCKASSGELGNVNSARIPRPFCGGSRGRRRRNI